MNKSDSVCVLALICLVSVFARLKAKHEYLKPIPGYNWNHQNVTIANSNKDDAMRQRRSAGVSSIVQETPRTHMETRITPAGDGSGQVRVGFCNHAYYNIDAAMRIDGTDFLFVDKEHVIDGRTGNKMPVNFLFKQGPEWPEAAVYANMTNKVYLFKNDKIWQYNYNNGSFKYQRIIENNNVESHHPECGFQYFGFPQLYIFKNQYFFKFMPFGSDDFVQDRSRKINTFSFAHHVAAAIATSQEIYFITGNLTYLRSTKQFVLTNTVFNQCITNAPTNASTNA